MIGAKGALTDGQCAYEQRLRLCYPAKVTQHQRKIAERICGVRVVGAERGLLDCQRPPEQRLRLCHPAKDAQRFLPFCSERCRMADLGKWLDGAYRIGTPVTEDDLDQGLDLDREPEA